MSVGVTGESERQSGLSVPPLSEPPIHPDLSRLSALLGTWSGSGRGEYPTIEAFEYHETVTFSHVGKPFLIYVQRTKHAGDGRLLHAETGYFRPAGERGVEVVIAHPNGIVEVAEGPFDGKTMCLSSTHVERTSTAKEVTQVQRDITLDAHSLQYELRMAAVGKPLLLHLSATLKRG